MKAKLGTYLKTKSRCLMSLLCCFGVQWIAAQSIEENIETIKVGGVAEVYFTFGEPTEIKKEIYGKVVPEVILEQKEGVFNVTTKGKAQGEVVKIYVSSPSLKNIIVNDRAQFHGTNTIESNTLRITSSDHGSVDLMVDSNEVHLFMDGGDIFISGTTNDCFIKIDETKTYGTINSANLNIKNL